MSPRRWWRRLAAGVVLASAAGAFNVDLFAFLFGSILTVTREDLVVVAVLGLAIIAEQTLSGLAEDLQELGERVPDELEAIVSFAAEFVGLILPPLVDIAPVLVPVSAVGLVLTMVGAVIVHARRTGEGKNVVFNLVLLLVAAIGQPLAGVVYVLDGILIGAGDGTFLAWAGIAVLAAYTPAALWAATLPHGLVAVWVAMTLVFMGARGVILGARAHGDRWVVTGVPSTR